MPWFRLDDSFHAHPKVLRAGNAAVGLWVRGGTYCARYGTDGLVPMEAVQDLAGHRREVELLVGSRLWVPADDGYLMPDFLQYNVSKAEDEQRRKNDAERKRVERGNVDRGSNGQYLSRRIP
jgi:hypothetical protein